MPWEVKTQPAVEPIQTSDARFNDHGKWGSSPTDANLIDQIYVPAARIYIEQLTGKAMISQTITEMFSGFPSVIPLKLSVMGVTSVTHVKYYDADDSLQTWSSSEYNTDLVSRIARINPAINYSYPSTSGRINAVEVEYVAGYANAADVPMHLIEAVMLLVGEMYEQRTDSIRRMPTRVADLVSREMKWCF